MKVKSSLHNIGQQEAINLLKRDTYTKPHMHDLVDKLIERFTHFRRVKGDGNCYYRAIGYAYIEYLALT